MIQTGFQEGSESRTVVVGIKLDSPSRELLTWALVKVADPGDCVIALHVLAKNEVYDRNGKSSLLSLVKAFDSVLAVYEGFCNLKQVDLKLKICRGSSVKKVLVREAESYSASKLIVGTARTHHAIRSTTSVAKYCAKKLPKACGVLAVNNGKVLFKKEDENPHQQQQEQQQRKQQKQASQNRLLFVSQVSPEDLEIPNPKPNCAVCSSPVPQKQIEEEAEEEEEDDDDDDDDKSMALVAVKPADSVPGWPLLRGGGVAVKSPAPEKLLVRQISVVQWAMQLPSRNISCDFDSETGAIVPFEASDSPPNEPETLPPELEGLHDKYASNCRLFEHRELSSATSNFSPENLVGRGGNSKVYKGCLSDGKELAVKILKPSEDVIKEFVMEIEIITTLNHTNIISLLGFCFENNNLLLVYDFLSRGSLEENIHGKMKDPIAFGWNERYKVALGVAEALDYLHSGSSQPVIHRDVKSSNILLSDDFEPQLSDFGLAKWASTTSTHITCSDVSGTFGYLAPEYFMYGKVSNKIDVYAFGVVLLELLSGRKPISNDSPKGQESLVMWAKPILNEGKVSKLLDPCLGSNYEHGQIERMVLAATLCIRRAPRARPQMSLVVKLLRGDPNVTKWARLQVNGLKDAEAVDDDEAPQSNLQSHLNLALLDVEDDSFSTSSVEQSVSLEDYLKGRWSRSSSFD